MKEVVSAPRAAVLVESMRDIGYSLETAIADIVDNSITAGATRIDIFADFLAAGPAIAILDNGCGMSADELRNAMRLGSQSPLDARPGADLGRFGLGMKTASFSQCRKLTVVSRQNGVTAGAIWDLDHVARTDDWKLKLFDDATKIPWFDDLVPTGNLVLWEKLDRLIEEPHSEKEVEYFTSRLSDAREHLELVFHRFLSSEHGRKRIVMSLNNRPLVPFDPFNSRNPATQVRPNSPEIITIQGKSVSVQSFTLPHHKMVSAEEWERHAGPDGYLKSQGFYVYRERRLIIWGTWFGLARQAELTKLTRVRIDMSNDLDADWKIDVRKASAQPPYQVKERLRRLIDALGETSRLVYTTRGKRRVSDQRLPVWTKIQEKDAISYRVNEGHPLLAEFMEALPEGLHSSFKHIVELVGAAFPVDMLFMDASSNPEKLSGVSLSREALDHTLVATVDKLLASGLDASTISLLLRPEEPFKSNWARVEEILGHLVRAGVES